MSTLETRTITAAELAARLDKRTPIAVLDVRTIAEFAENHLVVASSAPYDQLESRLAILAPLPNTPIVVVGDDDDRAVRAIRRAGYRDVAALAEGPLECADAGLAFIDGLHAVAKATAEWAEKNYGTTAITAEDLDELLQSSAGVLVLDTRTAEEFIDRAIPGSILCPGGEVVYRIRELAPAPDTPVVLTCGGRHRGIVAAQSLRHTGLRNPVRYLENGVNGWWLSGRGVTNGAVAALPQPSMSSLKWASEAAGSVAHRYGVVGIDVGTVRHILAGSDAVYYLFDVRSGEEYVRGHWPDSASAPAGQLVQDTDDYIAIRDAQVILLDSTDGVRSTNAAAWLGRQGYPHVYSAPVLDTHTAAESGDPAAPAHLQALQTADQMTPAEVKEVLIAGRATVVDLATSAQFNVGHIPGAVSTTRTQLESTQNWPHSSLVVTSPDGLLAAIVAADVGTMSPISVRALRGGTRAWVRSGRPLESTGESAAGKPDNWGPPADMAGFQTWFEEYLSWCSTVAERLASSDSLPVIKTSRAADRD